MRQDAESAARALRDAAMAAEQEPSMGPSVATWLRARAELIARHDLPPGWNRGAMVAARMSYSQPDMQAEVLSTYPDGIKLIVSVSPQPEAGYEAMRWSSQAAGMRRQRQPGEGVIATAATELECCEAADRHELGELRVLTQPIPAVLGYLLADVG